MPIHESQVPPILPPDAVAVVAELPTADPFRQRDVGPRKLLSGTVSWSVIGLLVAMHLVLSSFSGGEVEPEATKIDLLQVNMTAKVVVGARTLSENSALPLNISEIKDHDLPEPHWCEAILLSELGNATAAEELIQRIDQAVADQQISLTNSQQRLSELVSRIVGDHADDHWTGDSLTDEEKEFLTERLGFSGTLALTPKNSPDRSQRIDVESGAVAFAIAVVGLLLLFGSVVLLGTVGLCIILVAWLSRKIRSRFANETSRSHIYGETFAVWFASFTLLQIGIGLAAPPRSMLIWLGAGFFVSLAALGWPVARGISWKDVARDIGWRTDVNPIKEFACGLVAYVCLTPLIVVSILVVGLLSAFLSPTGAMLGQLDRRDAPSHPIVFELAKNDPLVIAAVLVLACIAAPIIEETMFRGVLYRHLRDSSAWLRRSLSVLLSAGINSLIFAAIHPQGLIGIPVLGTLAFGFSITREWRDSLLAPMAMHAINNGMATILLLLILNSLA